MAGEENQQVQNDLPLFPWDREIVDPMQVHQVAAHVAANLHIGVGYAESRFVRPYVAYDLLEW